MSGKYVMIGMIRAITEKAQLKTQKDLQLENIELLEAEAIGMGH